MKASNGTNTSTKKSKKIGFTCSSFDLLHAGHMLMLKDCKRVCDYLIVGLQSDPTTDPDSYRGKKKNMPVMSLEERKIILEGNKYIDEVFIYSDERDLYNNIKKLTYDIRIIGSDWEGKEYTGHDLPHEIYYHKRDHDFSTSNLRERVYKAEQERLKENKEKMESDIARSREEERTTVS